MPGLHGCTLVASTDTPVLGALSCVPLENSVWWWRESALGVGRSDFLFLSLSASDLTSKSVHVPVCKMETRTSTLCFAG